jgi:hypothetical protein
MYIERRTALDRVVMVGIDRSHDLARRQPVDIVAGDVVAPFGVGGDRMHGTHVDRGWPRSPEVHRFPAGLKGDRRQQDVERSGYEPGVGGEQSLACISVEVEDPSVVDQPADLIADDDISRRRKSCLSRERVDVGDPVRMPVRFGDEPGGLNDVSTFHGDDRFRTRLASQVAE